MTLLNYYNIINESSLAVTSGDQLYSGNVVIPDYVHHDGTGYSVTSIGGGAFYECRGLTSVTIPYGVVDIYVGAFSYCENLTSIDIPTSVYNIAENAFCNCYSLSNIIIPEGVEEIGNRAFAGCESLSTINTNKLDLPCKEKVTETQYVI